MARRQTAGRGRRGRSWEGGEANLTATLLLTLDKTPLEAAQLAFVAGLAAWTAITVYAPAAVVTLKWPNDVLIEGMVARIKAEYGRPLRVIGTGGMASLFQGATDCIDDFDPDITVRGLLEVWRRNT